MSLAVDGWLFAAHGLGRGLQQILRDPVDLLIVLGLSVLSAAFHECGHATGCRYGGARPGVVGVGIYLVWPSFFTNVTDSYRLSRAGRLRTDLGGLYFNLIFMLALAGIYAATSAEVLLIVIAVTHLEMLEQLLPFVRFDGYFILSDLAGVPDLFARIAPILRSAVTRGRPDPRAAGLRRRTRILVTGWVVCVVPLLTLGLGYLLLFFPQINRALWRSASQQAHLVASAAAGHHTRGPRSMPSASPWSRLSLAGSLYVVAGLARRLTAVGLRWSAGVPAAAFWSPRPGGVPDGACCLLDRARPVPRLSLGSPELSLSIFSGRCVGAPATASAAGARPRGVPVSSPGGARRGRASVRSPAWPPRRPRLRAGCRSEGWRRR